MSYLSKIFIPFLIKLILVLLLTFSLVVEAQNKNTSYSKNTKNSNAFLSGHKNFESRFETRIYDLFKNNDIQGDFILGIVDETGLVYSYALNKAIIEKKPYSLNNDSPIYVASHTKAMTGTLLKILEEEGKVNLDKTLYDYLPELTFKGKVDTKSITVRSLLNHTHGIDSGIVVYKTAYFGYSGSTKELLDDFNKSSKIKTSKKFSYSNLGSVLAGMIVERVTGNTWKEEMKKRMFVPLGMTNTSANVSDYVDSDIRPIVTVSKDNQIVRSGFYKQDITMHAAGGILSTINDLSKWLQTNINQDNKIIKSAISWKALHEPTTLMLKTLLNEKKHHF